jgi:hypothetical protein
MRGEKDVVKLAKAMWSDDRFLREAVDGGAGDAAFPQRLV